MNYPYCQFTFTEWNPMQAQCLPYLTKDGNLVVSASVASGKTAIAEAIMGYELSFGKCVYVSPLRSIGSERFEEWKRHPTFESRRPLLMDGDHHPEKGELEKAGIVITTVETMDMSCRSKQDWLGAVSLLVVDEAHFIGDETRGPSLEAMLMSFTSVNPRARLLLLSGTMSNARELAVWVKLLNGKPTAFVQSSWRPTPLKTRIEIAEGFRDTLDAVAREIPKNIKTLVFVHSKKLGEELCKRLRKKHTSCLFFTSDLDEVKRTQALGAFRSPCSGIDVLVSTSSLAMGVNI